MMLVTSQRMVFKEDFVRNREDCINYNLQKFVIESKPYVQLEICSPEDHCYKITHKAIILQLPLLSQLRSEIADLLNNGANPDIVARHICHFLIHK